MFGDLYVGESKFLVRTVNNVRPDAAGNVNVEGGSGSYTFSGTDGIGVSVSGSSVTVTLKDLQSYRTTGDGSTVAFTIPGGAVATIEEALVGEAPQAEGTHWSWTGNIVTFSTAPESGSEVTLRYRR